MDKGDIYCITSPSGKKYIGQCVKYLSNKKKWGYVNRWHSHIRDCFNGKNNCRLLNNAIKKYGSDNFNIELLIECTIDKLDYYENFYINKYNTMSPNGYNLITGKSLSRQSVETIELRKKSMIGKNLGKSYPKRKRIRDEDNELPKYLRYYNDNNGKEGYRITHHPTLKDRSFLSKKISLNDKLKLALNYLNGQT